MKIQELISKLNGYPPDMEVCVMDWRKNIFHSSEEPQGYGIEPHFTVDHINEDVNVPFIALSFNNDDYTSDGMPDEGSAIYSNIIHVAH